VYVTSSDDRPVQAGSVPQAAAPDPAARPSRRRFSREYKLAIVAEYEQAPNGQKGAILRREALYSSHIIEWTRARDAGVLTPGSADAANSGSRPRPARKSAEQLELEKLRRQNAKLHAELSKTRMALDIMGKAHALLEELSESAQNEPPSTR
jgi:transposase